MALAAAVGSLLMPAAATATSPVLEFVVPGSHLPVSFTTESGPVRAQMEGFGTLVHCESSRGEGEVTGPRSTVSHYQFSTCITEGGVDAGAECHSTGANPGEITTGPIEAELVFVSQSKDEVGMLLNPHGGTYITFECGGEPAEGIGAFIASVGPIDKQATSFTATLSQSGSVQTPDQYENANGEQQSAIPEGKRGTDPFAKTAVEMTAAVHTSVPLEIKAITAQEIEAEQQEAARAHEQQLEEEREAKKLEQEQAAKKLEEEQAADKHQEEATAQAAATAAKRLGEEEAAQATAAAAKKQQEQEAAAAHAKLPTLMIVRATVHDGELRLTLRTSAAGVVSVSGPGLGKTSKSLAAGLHDLRVAIAASARAGGHHRAAKVTIRLRVASATVSRALTVRL